MATMKPLLPLSASIFKPCALLVAVFLICTVLANQGQAEAPKKLVWMINTNALSLLRKQERFAQMESWFFDNPQTFVLGDGANSLPHCLPTITFTSYASFKKAIEAHSVGSSIKAVIYDNEFWQFTPAAEQKDALTYMKSFGVLARKAGLIYLAAPATNIVRAMDGQGPGQAYDRYLKLGIASAAAANADVYEIQGQGSENNPEYFAQFVKRAAEQARAANPKVVILAGISTNPSGKKVSAEMLVESVKQTRQYVSGYWLNIPSAGPWCPRCGVAQPQIAMVLLNDLLPGKENQ